MKCNDNDSEFHPEWRLPVLVAKTQVERERQQVQIEQGSYEVPAYIKQLTKSAAAPCPQVSYVS